MAEYVLLKWNSFVNILIFFILGLLLLIFPEESLNIGGYLIGSTLLLSALGNIIRIIRKKGVDTNADILYILLSVAFIGLSIYIFLNPDWIIKVINILVAIVLIVTSIMNMIGLLKLKKNRNKLYWVYFSFIIFVFIVGIITIINPVFMAKVIVQIEGATMIINAIITFLVARRITKALDTPIRAVEKVINSVEESEN